MGDLDSHEIGLLDAKYEKMMTDINTQIISRLMNSTILFDVKKKDSDDDASTTSINPDTLVEPIKSTIFVVITVEKFVQSIISYNIDTKNISTNT